MLKAPQKESEVLSFMTFTTSCRKAQASAMGILRESKISLYYIRACATVVIFQIGMRSLAVLLVPFEPLLFVILGRNNQQARGILKINAKKELTKYC